MARYRAAFTNTGVNAVDAVLANLKTVASDRAQLRRFFVGIEVAPTSAPIFGIKRMLAVGTGAITSATSMMSDLADGAAAAVLEVTWATARPTVTGGSGVRGAVPLAVGNGFVFDFTDSPLIVPISAGLCIVNLVASGATLGSFGGWAEWDE